MTLAIRISSNTSTRRRFLLKTNAGIAIDINQYEVKLCYFKQNGHALAYEWIADGGPLAIIDPLVGLVELSLKGDDVAEGSYVGLWRVTKGAEAWERRAPDLMVFAPSQF